jgi:hypothetical protein
MRAKPDQAVTYVAISTGCAIVIVTAVILMQAVLPT